MQGNDLSSIDPNTDYTQILPIQQKRMIAFINHFVMNTVSFLNKFAQSCESRLMDFEYKLQKVEASLLILESQLCSIPYLDVEENLLPTPVVETNQTTPLELDLPLIEEPSDMSKDPIYEKYFKMIQVGVPVPAVKLKMQSEGLDPSILDSAAPRQST